MIEHDDFVLIPKRSPAPMNGTRAEKDAWVEEAVDAAEASLRTRYGGDVDAALVRLDAALGSGNPAVAVAVDPDLETTISKTRDAVRMVARKALKDIK